MSHATAPGQIKVKSQDHQSLFVHERGKAFIWIGSAWHPLETKAKVSVNAQTKYINVRIARSDLAGLPEPSASILVEDPIAGWDGVVSVFEHG